MVKQFLKYAIPSAVAMFISSLYTVVDGIFVGQGVGSSALAAVNIVLPFTVLLFGIANMLAVGGGALVSKNVGAGNVDKAINIFRQVCKFLLIVSTIITLICVIFTEPIVKLLGTTDNLQELSVDYLRYYGIFCIPSLVGIVLNSFVRNDNRPKLAMVSTIAGAITNIILDYIFIFTLALGIKGAAIATGLGQIVTVSILLPHFIQKKGNLSFGRVKLDIESMREFCVIGVPSFLAQASFSVIVLLHNMTLVAFVGETGIAAYSIINYIITNAYMVLLGLTFGAQPLISLNYGKKNKKKMLGYYKINCISSIITTMFFTIVCYVFGRQLIGIFTTDVKIIELAYTGLRIAILAYFVAGINLNTIVYYQAIEMPRLSNMICLFRSVVFLPMTLIILAKIFGITGIWAGVLTAEIATIIAMSLIANVKSCTTKALSK